MERHPEGVEVYFDFEEGAIAIKNPGDAVLGKCLEMARRLEARVVGEEGEWYEAVGVPPRPFEAWAPPQFELASGSWEGIYRYGEKPANSFSNMIDALTRHRFRMRIVDEAGRVSGKILDGASLLGFSLGEADLWGAFDRQTGRLTFTKRYCGRRNADIQYEGQLAGGGHELRGKWSLVQYGLPASGTWEASWGGS